MTAKSIVLYLNVVYPPYMNKYYFKLFSTILLVFFYSQLWGQEFVIWGNTIDGGYNNQGVLYKCNSDGSDFKVIHYFGQNSTYGKGPATGLEKADNGLYYGTCSEGGNFFDGTLYEYDFSNNSIRDLVDFNSDENGQSPIGLTKSSGKIIGITYSGGINNYGTIFEFNPTSKKVITLIHCDTTLIGHNPISKLISVGGKLFGTTRYGGQNNNGTLFEFDPTTNQVKQIIDFDTKTTGQGRSRIMNYGNTIFGVCETGGENYAGTLFSYDITTRIFTKEVDFDLALKGGTPLSPPVFIRVD